MGVDQFLDLGVLIIIWGLVFPQMNLEEQMGYRLFSAMDFLPGLGIFPFWTVALVWAWHKNKSQQK